MAVMRKIVHFYRTRQHFFQDSRGPFVFRKVEKYCKQIRRAFIVISNLLVGWSM